MISAIPEPASAPVVVPPTAPTGSRMEAVLAAVEARAAAGDPSAIESPGEATGGAEDVGEATEPGAEGEASAAEAGGAGAPGGELATDAAAAPAVEVTDKQRTKDYIAAQKEYRRALKVKAEGVAARAEAQRLSAATQAQHAEVQAFHAARAQALTDPHAFFKAAGLDPHKFTQATIDAALRDGKPVEIDPVHAKVQEALQPYAEKLAQQEAQLEQQRYADARSRAFVQHMGPIFSAPDAAEKYETLFSQYGGAQQAAQKVFETVEAHFNAPATRGQLLSFADVAADLEAKLAETVEAGLKAALKLKRFAGKYGVTVAAPLAAAAKPPTTLTNKQNAAPAARRAASGSGGTITAPTRNTRAERVLKKFGLSG